MTTKDKLRTRKNKNRALPKRKRHIEFYVTHEHIEAAICGDARHCAIALCMAATLKLAHGYINVSAQGLKFTEGEVRWRAFCSNRVLAWFAQFDAWGKGLADKPDPIRFQAAFEAYAFKQIREDGERIKANRQARVAKLRANGQKPKQYGNRERLVGVSIAA